jgi:hypothetical protein
MYKGGMASNDTMRSFMKMSMDKDKDMMRL